MKVVGLQTDLEKDFVMPLQEQLEAEPSADPLARSTLNERVAMMWPMARAACKGYPWRRTPNAPHVMSRFHRGLHRRFNTFTGFGAVRLVWLKVAAV